MKMPQSFGASVVVIQGESVLLTLREDFHVWCLPGGAVEVGECVAEAAIREVFEETGVEIGLDRLVGIYYNNQLGGHQSLFLAHPIAGEPRPDGHETLKAEWFSTGQLPKLIIGWHRLYIQDALENGPSVVCRINIPSLDVLTHLTRREIYSLRDEGKLDVHAIIASLCSPVGEDNFQRLLS